VFGCWVEDRLVVNEMGPPTSMGESARLDGVGLWAALLDILEKEKN
jgi:hypothetical protein